MPAKRSTPTEKQQPLGRLTVHRQILLGCVPLAVLSIIALVLAGDRLTQAVLRDQVVRHLESVRAQQQLALETYLRRLRDEMASNARNPATRQALEQLRLDTVELEDHPFTAGAEIRPYMISLRNHLSNYYERQLSSGSLRIEELLVPQRSAVWLQAVYVAGNGAEKEAGGRGSGTSPPGYVADHARWDPMFRQMAETLGLADLLLVDAGDGRIVYTAGKGPEFQTSLVDGPYAESKLGALFYRIRHTAKEGDAWFVDFAPYVPRHGLPAAFVASPIFANQAMVGVLVGQLSSREISRLLSAERRWEELGLGATGDLYVIGPDALMRSERRFGEQLARVDPRVAEAGGAVLVHEVKSIGAARANAGETFAGTYANDLGVPVLGATGRLMLAGLDWRLLAEIEEAEALQPLARFRRGAGFVALGLVAAVVLGGIWVASRVSRPVREMLDTVRAIQQGDLEARAPARGYGEFGFLARGLNSLLDQYVKLRRRRGVEREKLESEMRDLLSMVAAIGKGDCSQRARTNGAFGELGNALNAACDSIGQTLQQVRGIPAQVMESATPLRDAAEQVVQGANRQIDELNRTAAGIGEMASAIEEVAAQSAAAAEAARRVEAGTRAEGEALRRLGDGMELLQKSTRASASRMKRLGERSMEVSAVVGIVGKIAAEINMVALNVAIEAARTGGDGAGFAVVADEVRRLAERTEAARAEVERAIDALQAEANEAVAGMNRHTDHVEQYRRWVGDAERLLDGSVRDATGFVGAVSEMSVAVSQRVGGAAALTSKIEGAADWARRTRAIAVRAQGQMGSLLAMATELGLQLRGVAATSGDADGSAGNGGAVADGAPRGGTHV